MGDSFVIEVNVATGHEKAGGGENHTQRGSSACLDARDLDI